MCYLLGLCIVLMLCCFHLMYKQLMKLRLLLSVLCIVVAQLNKAFGFWIVFLIVLMPCFALFVI